MKKFIQCKFRAIYFICFFICLAYFQLPAQEFVCFVEEEKGGPKGLNTACPELDFTEEEIQTLPAATVMVNIHFVGHAIFGNFYPGTPDDLNPLNGTRYAELMLERANERLADLTPSPTSLADFLGDSKIRYELYTEPGNTNDLHGGVWYWPSEAQMQLSYGTNVLNIVIIAQNTPSNAIVGGNACGLNLCNRVNLFDAYFHAAQGNQWGWWAYANILNHEFGHIAGLCHTFYCNNNCAGIDINPNAECNGNGGCFNNCGTSPGNNCNPWFSGSTNIMGYNNNSRSLTPCQWQTIMKNLVYRTPGWVHFCDDPIEPLVISGGSHIIWDKLKLVNRDIVIEPMASLTVLCEVRMAKDRNILVHRGARLIVEDGKLTNLCKGNKWSGVRVFGNNDISHNLVDVNGPLMASNPGIVLLEEAEVENARQAVSCNPPAPWPEQAKNWNGVVIASNTVFRNNKRSVEFMLDDKTQITGNTFTVIGENINISRFKACSFLNEDGTAVDGVTDWAAGNIAFDECKFMNLTGMGVQTWDAGVQISKCLFEGNNFGVHATATMDLSSQLVIGGQSAETGNVFRSNYNGIYSSTIQDIIVSHNQFVNNQIGFYAFGESEYDINNNTFSGGKAGIGNWQTGNGWKQSNCNIYTNPQVGISNQGDNAGLQFLQEEFFNTFNVYLTDFLSAGTGILPNQGNVNAARWNYFTNGSNNRIVTFGNTQPFYYYYPQSSNNPRTFPRCSLNDNANCNTVNNFYSIPTDNGLAGCLGFFGENPPEISLQNLDAVRQEIAQLEYLIGQNPPNLQELESDLIEKQTEKAFIVNRLTKAWLAAGNFIDAEQLCEDEGEIRKLIGLKLRQGKWNDAENLLLYMPEEDRSDLYFKQTGLINLARLKTAPTTYVLSSNELATLNTIRQSLTDAAPYAGALLNLLTGSVMTPNIPDPVQYREMADEPVATAANGFAVVPNPASGEVTLLVPADLAGENVFARITHLTGLTVATINLEGQQQVEYSLAGLPAGIYLVALMREGRALHSTKLVVQR